MNGVNEMFCFNCHRLSAHAMLAHTLHFLVTKVLKIFRKEMKLLSYS